MNDGVASDYSEILLVDDERETCEEIAEFLDAHGYVCHNASSVDEALTALDAQDAVGVILTDLRMPRRSGLDLVRAVVNADDGRKVIVMTGHKTAAYADSSALCGAAGFLTKPLDPYEVLDAVRRAFGDVETSRSEAP